MSSLQQGQGDGIANTVTSQKNSVRLDGLKANARYMVQVRARTVAGYGRYSLPTEFQTTAEDGRYRNGSASIPQPSYTCLLPSLTLIPAYPCARLHRQDFPGASSHRGFSHRGTAVCHRGGHHRYCLLQVVALQGVVAWSEAGVAYACGQSSGSSGLRAEGWTCCTGVLLPGEELSGFVCLCWDLEAGSECLCPIRKGMVTEQLLSSPLGRKQRNSTDPEYTEKLQQYGECEANTCAFP